ncbi:MAG: glycosyltransferase family 39 protein, partial [Rhizonema sp. PD37]|nr:glycosyltransferase family 39 protein [Rhizonema sp. PD37]
MRHLILAPNWLRFLIVVLLVLGVFFRFFNLENKVYWHDETYTLLRISGYTAVEAKQQIFNGHVITKEEFAKFQHPNLEKGFGDTIKSLAIEDPQHPPLYYVIARFWVQIFGNSVTAIRSLSVFISLLIFPCVYWLCRELFKVPLSVPYLIIALIAISPTQLIYAQEAREYILWVVTILLSSASLLRAMRLESKHQSQRDHIYNWGIYTTILVFGFYTSLLNGFVAIVHVIYVLAISRFGWTKTLKSYFIALSMAFLVFIPWIFVVIANFKQFQASTAWTTMKIPLLQLIQSRLLHVSRIFVDFNLGIDNNLNYLITPTIFIFVGYSIYFLYRTTHPKVWLFLVTLIVLPAVSFILQDLIFGGVRSISDQYLIPSYLGIQLAVAYTLATQLYNGILSRRKIWQTILAVIVAGGIVSYGVISQAHTWWSNIVSYGNPQVAKIINQASRPLLISNAFGANYGNIFSLSYLLQPKVRFLLLRTDKINKIPQGYNN